MAAVSLRKSNARLPPEVNRMLYMRDLQFNISSEEMYDIFGKYGAIRQIRLGNAKDTRGTAFVVYEDIYDAKNTVSTEAKEEAAVACIEGRRQIRRFEEPATKQSHTSDGGRRSAGRRTGRRSRGLGPGASAGGAAGLRRGGSETKPPQAEVARIRGRAPTRGRPRSKDRRLR